ncbi:MAG: hypothetical protein RR614_08845, partial [Eubacterium sp.]
ASNMVAPLVATNNGTINYCTVNAKTAGITGNGGVAAINNGTIHDCKVTGKITGTGNVGGITGSNTMTVKNCTFSGAVSGTTAAGGIVGDTAEGSIVSGCLTINGSTVTATGAGSKAGGSVGAMALSANLSDCTVGNGTVTSTNGTAGGIAGESKGFVSNSQFNGGTVNGKIAGGIVGKTLKEGETPATIRKSTAQGTINGTEIAGGMAGVNGGSIDNVYTQTTVQTAPIRGGAVGQNAGTIFNSYSAGTVGTHSPTIGGFVGTHDAGIINGCGTNDNSFAGVNYDSKSIGPVIGADGIYNLEVWAEDEAIDASDVKNKSGVYKQTIKADTTTPDPSITVENIEYKGNPDAGNLSYTTTYDGTVKVKVASNDMTSGMNKLEYTIKNRDHSVYKKGAFNGPIGSFEIPAFFEGYIELTATDASGLQKTIKTEGITVDSSLPSVRATAKLNGTEDYTGAWTNGEVTADLSYVKKNETTAGKFSSYQVKKDGGGWTPIPNSGTSNYNGYPLTSSGVYQFRASITDGADGARESLASSEISVQIDKEKPTLSAALPETP